MELEDVSVHYGDTAALSGTTAAAPPGSLVCLIGLNGSGKTSILKAIAGSVAFDGHIRVNGVEGPERRRHLAYVPQREAVEWGFPISVLDVVMLGRTEHLRRVGPSSPATRSLALAALGALGMEELAWRSIGELSGGQQQRVMLARALCSSAPVLLLDEPMNGVDPTTREVVAGLLRRHCAAGGTVLMATHDVAGSAALATVIWGVNRTVVAEVAPGRLLELDVLRAIYGDTLLVLPGGRVALGDQSA